MVFPECGEPQIAIVLAIIAHLDFIKNFVLLFKEFISQLLVSARDEDSVNLAVILVFSEQFRLIRVNQKRQRSRKFVAAIVIPDQFVFVNALCGCRCDDPNIL